MNYTEFCSGFVNTTVTYGSGNWQLAWLLNNILLVFFVLIVMSILFQLKPRVWWRGK